MQQIPYGRQDITQADIDAVVAVLQSDYLTQGPMVPKFEQAVASYCGTTHALAVNSATSALHIACLALSLGPGEVHFVATQGLRSAACADACARARGSACADVCAITRRGSERPWSAVMRSSAQCAAASPRCDCQNIARNQQKRRPGEGRLTCPPALTSCRRWRFFWWPGAESTAFFLD